MYTAQLSWSTVQYMVAEVQYGGKVTDNMDRRLFATYANVWYAPRTLDAAFTFNPAHPIAKIPGDFKYIVPDFPEIDAYRRFTASLPEIDTPEIYGLHPNADLTFRLKEATAFITTLSDTQPKQAGGGAGRSLDDVVMDKAAELLGKLPADYVEEEYRARIRKLGGLGEPLNIFLYQEIQRLQSVIGKVRSMLNAMQQAIRGEIVMTAELLQAMTDIFDAKVPRSWLFTPGGDEFSWLIPALGMWFASLLERDTQLRTWLTTTRPNSYWMAGFSNPQGFLTAMKQEVTRLHRAQHWALDDVEYYAEVTEMERPDAVRAPPKEGVYVHTTFVEGARWDKHTASLAESEPKKLFAPMPVVFITAVAKGPLKEKMDALGQCYSCPVYRYPTRTERYRILSIPLPSRGISPDAWTLRGVCLLALTLS
jgi:dynein heavy chain